MGGVSTPGGDGLNVDLNLVPFIDLLSSLVLFLLLSAVWIQVASIPAQLNAPGGHSSTPKEPPRMVTIRLDESGMTLTWPAVQKSGGQKLPVKIAKTTAGYNFNELKSIMDEAKKLNAAEEASLEGQDTVPYGEVIEALDTVKSSGFGVAISTN